MEIKKKQRCIFIYIYMDMGVSENRGKTPKWMVIRL